MPVIETSSFASLFAAPEVDGTPRKGVPGALTERERFRMRLRRRPLLLDGAMGTLLFHSALAWTNWS
jgi:hypothetical protein